MAKDLGRVATGGTMRFRLALAVVCLAGGTGCTFWQSSGGGPLLKDAAYAFHGRAPHVLTPAEKDSYDQLFATGFWQGIPETVVGLAGNATLARQRTTHDLEALPILGYWRTASVLLVGAKDKRWRLAGQATGLAPGFPLAILGLAAWERWYHVDQADEVATRGHFGLGPLGLVIGYSYAVLPSSVPAEAANVCLASPAAAGRQVAAALAGGTDRVRYTSRWAWQVLGGLVAWGRVNRRCYLQVAWIPVPLWEVGQ